MNNKYTCDMCYNTYEKGWSDEEAMKEAEEIFGKPVKDWNCDKSVICDDCFNKINPRKFPEILKESIKNI